MLDAFWPPTDWSKSLYDTCENIYRNTFFPFYFTHMYLAQYMEKNKTTIWQCIKNWCGMLVRAHEPNDKVSEAEIVEYSICRKCAFRTISVTTFYVRKNPDPKMKAIPNRDHVWAENVAENVAKNHVKSSVSISKYGLHGEVGSEKMQRCDVQISEGCVWQKTLGHPERSSVKDSNINVVVLWA